MNRINIFLLVVILIGCNSRGETDSALKEKELDEIKIEEDIEKPSKTELISIIREKYGAIEYNLKYYKEVKKDLMGESTEGGELKGFTKDGELKKIIASYYGEMGKLTEEYYFSDKKLFFGFTTAYEYNKPINFEDSKVERKIENRYYFNNDLLIKWLDPNKNEVSESGFLQKGNEIIKKVDVLKGKF